MSDHFIPLRRGELIDLLCALPESAAEDNELFRQFCQRITATCQFEYNRLLEKLKTGYAPFDPDCDTKALTRLRSEERQRMVSDLLTDFARVMERANYKHLSREDIEPTVGHRSNWGLLVDVDFRIFERLAMFARGDVVERRPLRRVRRLYREEEVDVSIHERLVMIMKLRKHPRLGRWVDTDKVYLQIFKSIPKLDINMLLPGARVRMTRIDRSKIGFPMLSGLGITAYNIAHDFANIIIHSLSEPMILWGLATGAISYGSKAYFNYLTTRQRYNLNLTQVLYFQNLDTNAGVLFRVLDEAQEQECREVFLTFYCLGRHRDGLSPAELRTTIDQLLQQHADLALHVEVESALERLVKLGVAEKRDDRYRAVSIRAALVALDAHWTAYFHSAAPNHWSTILKPREFVPDYMV